MARRIRRPARATKKTSPRWVGRWGLEAHHPSWMYGSLEQAISTFTDPKTWESEGTPTSFRFFLEHDPDLTHELMCEAIFGDWDRWTSRLMILSGFDRAGRPVNLSEMNLTELEGHEVHESLFELPASDPHFALHETRFLFDREPTLAKQVGLRHPFERLLDAYERARAVAMGEVVAPFEVQRRELAWWQIELVERFDSGEPDAMPHAERVEDMRLDWLRLHLLAPLPGESELEESSFLTMLRESRQERWAILKPETFHYDRGENLLTFEDEHPLVDEIADAIVRWFGRYPHIEHGRLRGS